MEKTMKKGQRRMFKQQVGRVWRSENNVNNSSKKRNGHTKRIRTNANQRRNDAIKNLLKKVSSILVKRGDVYWAELTDGAVGSEQSGVRPVLILQNDVGNKFSPTTIVACITSQIDKGKLPTHVEVGKRHGLNRDSVILLEQIRTIDKQRLSDRITHLDEDIMKEIDKAMMISLGLAW